MYEYMNPSSQRVLGLPVPAKKIYRIKEKRYCSRNLLDGHRNHFLLRFVLNILDNAPGNKHNSGCIVMLPVSRPPKEVPIET